ncbi:ferredoxin--NADP reductase [Ruegeria halocynthiae]|uniref:ferredoxin--NADP reductase n=1 Tax=Ruegeria halocynthiae TaxID=985054 RepID=UPI00055EDE94|nr:ferredoxin--NADP reductase [Ruegeria halocynthiae]
MRRDFHILKISDIRQEIDGAATSVTFHVPPELTDLFQWQAGQHLTLKFLIDGKEHRRSYTISNPPGAALRITVKRVKGGVVSNHIGGALTIGDQVEVMPPFGQFTLHPGALKRRTHYFFGAGSGITPLYAMINAVLDGEPYSVAHLVYGNTNVETILFHAQLEQLLTRFPTRFTIRHVLSAPSMWASLRPWRKGRLDAETVQAAIAEAPPVAQDAQYWICGPGGMNVDVKAALTGLDVPADRIHMESFGAAADDNDNVQGIAATARVELAGSVSEIPVAADQTLLEAARAAGLAPPFSCQSGVCGACVARLTDGSVQMRNHVALEDADIAKGLILTCQSVATQEALAVKFEG